MIKLAAVQNDPLHSAGASQVHRRLSNASHRKKFEKVVMPIGMLLYYPYLTDVPAYFAILTLFES